MDLHGALIEVIKASDCGIVGVRGIVVAETANTVVVVTKRDRAIVIPKRVAVVQFMVGGDAVQLSLRGLAVRASERSAKKFKKKYVSL